MLLNELESAAQNDKWIFNEEIWESHTREDSRVKAFIDVLNYGKNLSRRLEELKGLVTGCYHLDCRTDKKNYEHGRDKYYELSVNIIPLLNEFDSIYNSFSSFLYTSSFVSPKQIGFDFFEKKRLVRESYTKSAELDDYKNSNYFFLDYELCRLCEMDNDKYECSNLEYFIDLLEKMELEIWRRENTKGDTSSKLRDIRDRLHEFYEEATRVAIEYVELEIEYDLQKKRKNLTC